MGVRGALAAREEITFAQGEKKGGGNIKKG